jgi:CheY-like chemotaxis protein
VRGCRRDDHRPRHPQNSIRLLALSANAAPNALAKGLEAGFSHYLTRPLKAGPFIEALEYALEFAALERAEQL